ncbi:MAG: DUF938 domain-containing protein [Gammaproteobacteria bacterium]
MKNRDPLSGLKNFEDIVCLSRHHGLELANDFEMPANNRLLVFFTGRYQLK